MATHRRKKQKKKGKQGRTTKPYPFEFRLKVVKLYLEDGYPTPNPNGSMVHGRHNGVSLNFQEKIPTARMPNIAPMILETILFHPSHSCLTESNIELPCMQLSSPKSALYNAVT
jgi:hypothetical protein